MASIAGHFKAELRDGLATFGRWWKRGLLAVAGLHALAGAVSVPRGDGVGAGVVSLLVFCGFGVVQGAVAGVFVGGIALSWRLFGWATLLPLGLVPLLVGASLWLGSGWVESSAAGFGAAVQEAAIGAGAETLEDLGPFPAARIGGPFGAIVLLLVLLWMIPKFLGAFFATGAVWVALLKLLVALATLIGAGLFVGVVISLPPLVVAFAIRVRRRARERAE